MTRSRATISVCSRIIKIIGYMSGTRHRGFVFIVMALKGCQVVSWHCIPINEGQRASASSHGLSERKNTSLELRMQDARELPRAEAALCLEIAAQMSDPNPRRTASRGCRVSRPSIGT